MAKLQNYNGHYCESEYEYAFLSFLENEGWHYLAGNSIPRDSKRDVLYMDDMEQFLSKTNPDLTANYCKKIIAPERLKGMLIAPWCCTTEDFLPWIDESTDLLAAARKIIEG